MVMIAVCDDELIHLRRTVELLNTLPQLDGTLILSFHSPMDMLSEIAQARARVDIAILDIQMQRNGIETAREINRLCPDCQIIFLTAYLGFATQVYDVEHAYFVLKGEIEQRLGPAIDRALFRIDSRQERRIALTFDGKTELLRACDIQYIERSMRRTRVVCLSGEHITYQPIAQLIDGMESRFVRCHNSFFVNARHVQSIMPNQLVLRSGHVVPISRAFSASARRQLLRAAARIE